MYNDLQCGLFDKYELVQPLFSHSKFALVLVPFYVEAQCLQRLFERESVSAVDEIIVDT